MFIISEMSKKFLVSGVLTTSEMGVFVMGIPRRRWGASSAVATASSGDVPDTGDIATTSERSRAPAENEYDETRAGDLGSEIRNMTPV